MLFYGAMAVLIGLIFWVWGGRPEWGDENAELVIAVSVLAGVFWPLLGLYVVLSGHELGSRAE